MSNEFVPAPASGSPTYKPSVLSLEGVMNFRDVGGLVTRDGKRVKRGVLWRSAGLDTATDRDIQLIRTLGLASIVDLRGEEERRAHRTHPQITQGVRTIWSTAGGLPNRSEFVQTFGQIREADALGLAIQQLYRSIAEKHASHLRLVFEALAADTLPMLIHCAAGKDRTGVAIALILETLGVERADILADYARTNEFLDWNRLTIAAATGTGLNDGAMAALPPEAMDMLRRADRSYLEAALADLEDRHGNVRAFLRQHVGIDQDTITQARTNLLET